MAADNVKELLWACLYGGILILVPAVCSLRDIWKKKKK